jgi:hypothetical protein
MPARAPPSFRTRLALIGGIVLCAGLALAAWVYLTAPNDDADVLGYEVMSGNVYAIAPEDSKTYRHDVELYGGKAALLADDFNRWFASLWQGKQLAYTLTLLTIVVALACFWAARALPELPSAGDGGRDA